MKTLFGFLGASLMAVSFLSAAPNMSSCHCQNCNCTQERHCGCFSRGCQCSSQACQCSENCQCGYNCACGSNCACK
ncbi:hypothetical protein BN1013_02354 [Candidatus Rubidus massiliensis]|nr:hypothetical protein BN1013_02354 [Candidatus Rubidus massiliensis]